MRKGIWLSLSVLGALLAFCLWNSTAVTSQTDRWQAQLQQIEALAKAEDWAGASAALENSYADWLSRQTWLHIVSEHDIIGDADAMYHRAMAFADTEEPSEFRAEIADLSVQLYLLAETARFHIGNIL